ncbi:MAG: signal recognition particle-docking protein FtsY, partial [Magnetococcales bacterium]|nr:signal recognition particle-docking protein FtsY [Magnetococcales bacterium]
HQDQGADSASVIHDAFSAARSRNMDLLIGDTAGRLHTKSNLMDELIKVKRVVSRLDPAAPHDIWLVLDATTGQNGLNQARQFHQSIGLTGLVVTKLDGTAKGGVLVAITEELGLPLRFVGVGEGIDDLKPFVAKDFVEALFVRG